MMNIAEIPLITPTEVSVSTRYIPALDGLRALSILFVIYAHSLWMLPARLQHGFSLGLAGVNICFVISGFLITSQLVAEKKRTGTVHIGRFMIRRALRLFPASFTLIAVIVLASYLGLVRLTAGEFWHAVTYTMDYYHSNYRPLEHLWSLSVEEQFYIVWPLLVLAFAPARLRMWCILAAVLCPLIRTWAWYSGAVEHMMILRRFEMVADTIAWGCLLALMKERLPGWTSSSAAGIAALFVIVLDCTLVRNMNSFQVAQVSVNSIAAAILIRSLINPNSAIAKVFSWRPLVWLGTISYSLYLWQPPFQTIPDVPGYMMLRLAGALAAATLSYYFIEQPLRNWGRRFRPSVRLGSHVAAPQVSA